jgi:hypothetical protein
MENPAAGLDPLMFWIEHSVGKGGSNRPADVQMIQFILNVVHLDLLNSFRMRSLLQWDGICGPQTLNAIVAYQEHKKDEGGRWPLFAIDGLVTAHRASFMAPTKGGYHFGFSTLFNLNWDFMEAIPRVNQAFALVGGYTAEPLYSTVVLPLQKAGVL